MHDQSVDRQRPTFARDARQSEMTENDCIFNSREPILHLMRGEWNAADELVRVKPRAYHGAPFFMSLSTLAHPALLP
jgi:hypothetical protein